MIDGLFVRGQLVVRLLDERVTGSKEQNQVDRKTMGTVGFVDLPKASNGL